MAMSTGFQLPPRERLAAIAAAAIEVFGRLGYRGTRTAEVAAKAGMSTGSLFTYVESKEALFHLVFLYCLRLLPDSPELPLRTPEPGATVALFAQALDGAPMSCLHAALVGDEPADVAGELRGIVAEIYDTLERAWPLLSVVERCAPKTGARNGVVRRRPRGHIRRPGRVPAAAGGQWAVAPDARHPHGGARGR
jgi:AcrR family transcriptional regulator